jgi:hypothetical protein
LKFFAISIRKVSPKRGMMHDMVESGLHRGNKDSTEEDIHHIHDSSLAERIFVPRNIRVQYLRMWPEV